MTNASPAPGRLAVHQFVFPGWRAWVDGTPVPVGVAPAIPEQQARPGFIVVDVPPGEHTVGLAFGPTPARLLGEGLSLLSVLVLVSLPLRHLWAGGLAPRMLAVALWVAGGGAASGLGWGSVAPASGPAVPEVARPEPMAGVWAAPDLGGAPAPGWW